jgi:hypothetical protein
MQLKRFTAIGVFLVGILLLSSCGDSNKKPAFQKNPVDDIIRDLNSENNFSVILYDMDYSENDDIYKHKYQVIVLKELAAADAKPQSEDLSDFQEMEEVPTGAPADTAISEITDWKRVTPEFFNEHIDNMGMEIVSKIDGKVEKKVAPPGYSNYVGNEKYGQWRNDNSGNRFWEFYGRYAFMSSMFHLAMMPVQYSMWNNYHSVYRPYGRAYYGNNGNSRMYGTGSRFNSQAMANTSYEKKPASFKQNVRNRVQRSSSTLNNKRTTNSRSTRTTRTSNSRMRSRSTGSGK